MHAHHNHGGYSNGFIDSYDKLTHSYNYLNI